MPKQEKNKAIKSEVVVEEKPPVDQTPIQEVKREEVVQVPSAPVVQAPPIVSAAPVVVVKKSYYDPVKNKVYRDSIRAAAVAGGHVFKEKGVGTGTTVKKVSKTGKEYYYQPWSQLTEEQKKSRLDQSRKRSAEDRVMAQRYKAEHPELFKKSEVA